jgi:hypothetical protein
MFFEAKDGRAFPVNRISMIHPPRDGVARVELTNGEVVETLSDHIAALKREVVAAFPAQPDTYVVTVDSEEAGGRVWKAAVIGWRLTGDGRAYPVTAAGAAAPDS